jgi:hypothetical protein
MNLLLHACVRAFTYAAASVPSHMLQEALTNEDDARHGPTVDELGPEAAALL